MYNDGSVERRGWHFEVGTRPGLNTGLLVVFGVVQGAALGCR